MKELKFRAWDEQKKVMHYNFQFIKSGEDGNDWIIFTSDKQTLKDAQHPFNNPYFQQQLKIMQYTGLKDKNDTEIYEGDILQWEGAYRDIKWVVTWDTMYIHSNWHSTGMRYEIIGNKFRNPELLNEQ
jgi:uncharacterized phage protein (TIGR01671 family)